MASTAKSGKAIAHPAHPVLPALWGLFNVHTAGVCQMGVYTGVCIHMCVCALSCANIYVHCRLLCHYLYWFSVYSVDVWRLGTE